MDMRSPGHRSDLRKYLAELIGTYALIFCGTGAIVINEQTQALGHGGIAMTFGLIVMALIYAFGETSGAHFNPAVTLGFVAARRFPIARAFPYIAAQVLGGVFASLTLHLLFPNDAMLGATIPSGSVWQSFFLEVILTWLLMLVILQVSQGSKETGLMAGIAIGATVGLEAMFAGPICGASMNPVRSLAPALVSGQLAQVWIYLTAPIAGSLLGTTTWQLIRNNDPKNT